jgi:hypothetical protein
MSDAPSYMEKIDLPSGDSLWYIDEHPTDPKQNHSYWRHNAETGKKGRRLSGVTTVVEALDIDPKNLLKWAAKTQCEGISLLYLESEGEEFLHWLSNAEAIWRELKDHGLTYDQVRDRKGKEGTNTHVLAFQALAMGRAVPDFAQLNEVEREKARAVAGFWLDHEPDAAQVEQVVYSEALGVAGRLDFRGTLTAECDNHICACHEAKGIGVIDLKTGGYIAESAHAQVGGGYPLLAEQSGFGKSKWAAILQVFEDGTYQFFNAEGTPEIFERTVQTYRDASSIRSASMAGWKARKTSRDTDPQIAEAVAAP